MKCQRFPHWTHHEPTGRRIAAAERRNGREREALALFADQIATEQEEPAARLARIEENNRRHWQSMRDHRAKEWRRWRRELAALPAPTAAAIREAWNASPAPKSSEYFANFAREAITRAKARTSSPAATTAPRRAEHMPRITVTVKPDGSTEVHAEGYTGRTCKDATRELEKLLGNVASDTPTREMHQTVPARNQAKS